MSFAVRMLGVGSIAPITIPSNWGITGPGPAPQTSAAKTLTVPSGNSGDLLFHFTLIPGTFQYRKNGGAFVGFSGDTTVNFADGDTLTFKLVSAADEGRVTVTDVSTNTSVGSSDISTN